MPLETALYLAAIVVLIALSAFFNGSETALTAASRARMHALEQEGNKRAQIVNRMLTAPEKMIGAILIGNTLVDVLASALAAGLALQGGAAVVQEGQLFQFLLHVLQGGRLYGVGHFIQQQIGEQLPGTVPGLADGVGGQ